MPSASRASGTLWILVCFVAFSAVLLVLFGTRHGPNVTSDSAEYLSGARNLAAGHGYANYALKPITEFPPAFSMTLALGHSIGVGAVDSARWINAFAFGLLVILTFILARRHVQRVVLAVVAAAAVGFSPAMSQVFASVWSEPIFCVLTVGLLLVLEPLAAKRGRDPRLLVAAGVLASIGFAYRYAGMTLLIVSVLVICLSAWRDGLAAVVRRALAFVAIASIVPAVVIARNLGHGPALGPRTSTNATIEEVVRDLTKTLNGWMLGLRSPPAAVWDILLFGGVLLVLFGFGLFVRKQGLRTPSVAALQPLVIFVIGYLVYLVSSELSTSIDNVRDRLLSPIFAPGVVLVVFSLEQLLDLNWVSGRKWLVRSLPAIVGLWLAVSLISSVEAARDNGTLGQGYAARSWIHSEFVADVGRLPAHVRIYSNVAEGLYAALDKEPIYFGPASGFYRSNETTNELPAFRRQVQESGTVYLAWTETEDRPWLIPPAVLRRNGLHLTSVAKTGDGTIYRVSAS